MNNRSNTSSKQSIYYNWIDKCFDNSFYNKEVVYINKKESKIEYNMKESDVFFKKMFEKKIFKKKIIKI